MANPKCPKCENDKFEMQELKVKNCIDSIHVIKCSSCDSIIFPFQTPLIISYLHRIMKKLGISK